nr:hypothetical protein [Agrobacterium vitis]
MLLSYEEQSPSIDPDAWIAQDATVCGDVVIGAGSRIMHGARLAAEAGGSIRIGRNCIVFENVVIRATSRHDCSVGEPLHRWSEQPCGRCSNRRPSVCRHRSRRVSWGANRTWIGSPHQRNRAPANAVGTGLDRTDRMG